jgi:hypothetical protein
VSKGSIKEMQQRFFEALRPGMEAHGFSPVPIDQAFHKPVSGGRWVLHISFIPHEGEFDLTADVAIRIDAVEDLVLRDNTAMLAKDKKRTATIGAELGNIADGRQRRWTVGSSTDIDLSAASVLKEFEAFGLPYLQRYSNLQTMLAAITSDDRSSWLHSPIHDARLKRALAVAVVLGQLATAREIAERGSEFLRSRKDPGAASFEAFARGMIPGTAEA